MFALLRNKFLLVLCLTGAAQALPAQEHAAYGVPIAATAAEQPDSTLQRPASSNDATQRLIDSLAQATGQSEAEIRNAIVHNGLTRYLNNERRKHRGLTNLSTEFVPKGQWVFGGTASYSTHSNESYQFFIIEGIDSKGYTFRISPMIAYALRPNMALGGRAIYSRTLLKLDNANLKFGDEETGTDIRVRDFYALRSSFEMAAIWRQYIPLGRSKRFALFNEMSLSGGFVQAKFANDSPVKGTFEKGYTLSLGVAPGIIAFATNNMAIEVNVGVMGITYNSTKQVHNQVTVGHRKTSMMNFKVNIFSIGLGMAFYL